MPGQPISNQMSNTIATANTIASTSSSEQSTFSPSEVSSAGAVTSQEPESSVQKQNNPAHRGPSRADQQSSEPLLDGNRGNQGSPAGQLQPTQPANSNPGGSPGSPAAPKQPNQPASPNRGGDQSHPATHPNHNGPTFAPILSDPFNFYDGAMFDPASNSMTSGFDRMAQAREINANLPASIQNAFNDNSINYYYPGIGDFYYTKVCSDAGCLIVQVAISCNCYVDGADQQLHYLTINQEAELRVSTFRNDTRLPPATKYLVKPGDMLFEIAVRYGVELSLILPANPAISNPDFISPAEVTHIPAQAYMVVKGDYLYEIAKA
ncbi:carbohydrate-binding module family 50 protein [Hyaloscypha hepaticicola]|uniref:Carbohydrate-binding module family 50 protein n=1 Tax=Hyaloscypha hepaticicola TaxID=2082293 RepID=A0A2J6PYM8_9HELO|nr:carbohydrate-binding module family 50 protein [Hyaloscypha hepaticicola]